MRHVVCTLRGVLFRSPVPRPEFPPNGLDCENGFGPLFANMLFAKSSKETGDTHTQEQPSKDDVFAESPKETSDTHAKQEKKQSMLLAKSSKETGGTHTPGADAQPLDMWI